MKQVDIKRNEVYTDDCGRFRRVLGFVDGFNGERRVIYDAGCYTFKSKWHVFETRDCTKRSFAKWAKRVHLLEVQA